jgi:Tol biopolymer transport system component
VDLFNLPTIPAPFSVNIDGSDNQPLVDPTTTSSYTWDWNSDGSRLLGVVFVDPQSDLISMAADGADVHAINLPLTEVDNPPGAWNADGTRVAFTSVAAGTTFPVTLYTATATGTDHQQVDAAPLSPRHFKWSPNGTRVAYTTGDGIYAADSDGSNHAELDSVVDMSSSFIANTSQAYYWGPNGADIAYVANQGSSTGYELYVGAADGTGNVKVSGTLAAGTNVTQATWVEIAP